MKMLKLSKMVRPSNLTSRHFINIHRACRDGTTEKQRHINRIQSEQTPLPRATEDRRGKKERNV
jgi:hypothetical protein